MITQTLDFENKCTGIYHGQKFIFDDEKIKKIAADTEYAWCYSPIFEGVDKSVTFLCLYSNSGTYSDLAAIEGSEYLKKIETYEKMIISQKNAASIAKVDISDICFFDLLPDHLMNKWFSCKEEVLRFLVESSPRTRPKCYEILHKIHVLVSKISKQKVNVSGSEKTIKYDMFSSSTGRLATKRGSYPILSISKEERASIVPKNDFFLELDLNGAEIRTLLSLSGKAQPNYDIHNFNKEIIAEPHLTRQEVKERFFAWLYNPDAQSLKFEKFYNKNIYKKYYSNGHIQTPFFRSLKTDERKALNYLTQSTTSDIVLDNAYNIINFLKGRNSFLAFTMHDSIILDFSKEEHFLVKDIKEIFENNIFGKFLSNVSIGKDYKNMRKITI